MPAIPAITVALPFYNAAATLKSAVESILGQTLTDWELLLLDDGSTDGSLDVARAVTDQRVRVISDGSRRGISARLNLAAAEARGRYFCRMDADDLAFPDRLRRQFDFLEAHPDVDLLGSSVLVFDDAGLVSGVIQVEEAHELICARPWLGFYLPHPTWMGRRAWFLEHSYDSAADGSEDQQLLYRGHPTSRYAGIPDVLLGYRENPRILARMVKRRLVFWRALAGAAVGAGAYHHAVLVSLAQILKLAGDILNLKMGIQAARNRLLAPDAAASSRWAEVWRKASGQQ